MKALKSIGMLSALILFFLVPFLISGVIAVTISSLIKLKLRVEGLDETDEKIEKDMFDTMVGALILDLFIIFHLSRRIFSPFVFTINRYFDILNVLKNGRRFHLVSY